MNSTVFKHPWGKDGEHDRWMVLSLRTSFHPACQLFTGLLAPPLLMPIIHMRSSPHRFSLHPSHAIANSWVYERSLANTEKSDHSLYICMQSFPFSRPAFMLG